MMQNNGRKVVLVDGRRIPFQRSGTGYQALMSYDLGRMALKGLIAETQLDPREVDQVILGTVISDLATSNVARECVLGAGLPQRIPAYTVTLACISANQAITNGVAAIATGQADVVIAGGTETFSDIPIRYRKAVRQRLIETRKCKTMWDYLKLLKGLRLRDLLPEVPNIAEFSTGMNMGVSCDRLAARFGVSREEQDRYAVRSHQAAAKATQEGLLAGEILPVRLPPKFETISVDNSFREDSSLEKMRALKPAFVKPYGTVTPGNSSSLTDGAAAVLLMAEEKARSLGYQPKAVVRGFVYTGQDPLEELLLGPPFAISSLLDRVKLSLSDIAVFEFHEAFAGQVLVALQCLASDRFAQERLGKKEKIGEVPLEKLNPLGGSLSLGHPFGATGARLMTTAANRLARENGQFAIVAGCAAGAMGNAILLERYA